MKLPNKYVAIDIETTDISSSRGEIIQIGAVILNEDGSMGAQFCTYIKPSTDYRNPEAMMVNKISEETLTLAPSFDNAMTAFEAFAVHHAGYRPQLAAWASYFDVAFLQDEYEKHGRRYKFSYKNLDLKGIAIWEAAKRDMDVSAFPAGGGVSGFLQVLGLEFEGSPHDGLCDIKNSVRILQAFL